MNKRVIENINMDKVNLDVTKWPQVLIDNFTPEKKQIFLHRKLAVEMYIKNCKQDEIHKRTGIKPKELRRLIKRCIQIQKNGQIWGFIALIPGKRIKSYQRKEGLSVLKNTNSRKMMGAFKCLLDYYPQIREKIEELYFQKKKGNVVDPKFKKKHLHKHFLDECRAAGIKLNEYPFNTEDRGRRSLNRYVKELENKNFYSTAKLNGDDAARNVRLINNSNPEKPLILRPFERVQFDGHPIDMKCSLTFRTPEGDEITKDLERFWLLAIIDVVSVTILSYFISLNREYTSTDVLYCIKKAIIPKEYKQLTIPGLAYPENGGYTSLAIPETKWAVWDEFWYDNGKANLSEIVKRKLVEMLGSAINAGPIKTPERRTIIEYFFRTYEENLIHRLPSTTGSNPSDPVRKNPEKNAIKFRISYEHLEELTEIWIAEYNNTPNERLKNLSPLEVMKQRIGQGYLPRILSAEEINDVAFLSFHTHRTVKGNKEIGLTPYINYEGVKYRNDLLSHCPGLIGQQLELLINMDDLRFIRAFHDDGSELGILSAVGNWLRSPHTLQMRKEINKLKNLKMLYYTSTDDPVIVYQSYLRSSAKERKTSRKQLLALNRNLEEKSKVGTNDKDNFQNVSEEKEEIKLSFKNEPSKTPSVRVTKTISY